MSAYNCGNILKINRLWRTRNIASLPSSPSKPSLKGGFGRVRGFGKVFYFKIRLIRAVTSLTLISPSPLMSHTASE